MAKTPGGNKKTLGSVRSKAGLPAKAGRRRPPHIKSVKDKNGVKQYETVSRPEPKPQKKTA